MNEYQCCLCQYQFNDEHIIAGPRAFESLSPCCKSEDFDLSPEAHAKYKAMYDIQPISVMPVSTANLEAQAKRMLSRIAENVQ